jgi:Na+-translocating ferredoxin:NAD+ oxidoreductase RNF subunit RnfB
MVLTAILTMVGLGILFAGVLAVANQRLKVEEDPRIEGLTQKLPGLNCGACGFPSCREFAKGLIEGDRQAIESICRVAGPDVLEFISKIAPIEKTRAGKIAVVFCGAKNKDRTKKAVYKGIETCRSANIIFDGGMNCEYGCLGFGDCEKVCPFDALHMVDGLPQIDPNKCVGGGKCVKACPRNIIKLMPCDVDNLVIPACNSTYSGAFVKKICPVGCIGCKICEKLSDGVFFVEDNLARLNTERMKEKINWGEVIKKCPTKTIVRIK